MNYRHIRGPEFDPATGLVSGEIELDGGLPPEEPDDALDAERAQALRELDASWLAEIDAASDEELER